MAKVVAISIESLQARIKEAEKSALESHIARIDRLESDMIILVEHLVPDTCPRVVEQLKKDMVYTAKFREILKQDPLSPFIGTSLDFMEFFIKQLYKRIY